ncbi:MAG: nuclear transport factor 2 family protein [Pseudomonadota bacterium]
MNLSIEQKLAIHEMLSRAAYAYDQRDLELLESGFTEQAEMSLCIAKGDLIGPFVGREAIMGLMRSSMADQTDVRRHVVSNVFFEREGDKPIAISNLTLVATENGTANMLATGIYRDELVEEGGKWKIVKRHVEMDSSY